jgi:hypothetical protein
MLVLSGFLVGSPMTESRSEQLAQVHTQQQLRLLAMLHYVLGGITAAFAPLCAYLAWLGLPLLQPPSDAGVYRGVGFLDPLLVGAFLVTLGVVLGMLSLMHGAILAYVGRCIARRRRRVLCLVFSAFDLMYVPLGTAIGIYALVLLTRPAIKPLFR